jgi:hypothetical protein
VYKNACLVGLLVYSIHTKASAALKTLSKTTTPKNMKTQTIEDENSMESLFGEVMSTYSRAQGIQDGVLVDVSDALTPCPFKYPVAMSRAAYEATIAIGGEWVAIENPTDDMIEKLQLPGGQDVAGRLHDVFSMALEAIRRGTTTDRIWFSVLVDTHGNGRKTKVDLYSVCGPGDTAAPVITIMLRGED